MSSDPPPDMTVGERSRRLFEQGLHALRAAEEFAPDSEAGPAVAPPDLNALDGRLAVCGGNLRELLSSADENSDWRALAAASSALADLHSARYEINSHLMRDRNQRLNRLEEGLGRLRGIHDPDNLIMQVCPTVVEDCGFDRVLLSRIEGSVWRPWRAHTTIVGPDEQGFRAWMEERPEIRLEHMLVESEVVRKRDSSIVTPDGSGRTVAADFARSRGMTSYVVAPLAPGDDVIGLLHADHRDRDVTELDLHILTTFAKAFGLVFERAVLLRRLESQRDRVRETVRSVESMLDELANAEIALSARALSSERPLTRSSSAPPSSTLEALLTKREYEVLSLMAAGGTNARIADKLVITPDTVKSHVGRILRKLRVDNRAEAVSKYLRLTLGHTD